MGLEERTVCFDRDLEIEAYHFKGVMQKFPNHFHEYYVIGYIESGKRRLSCKNYEYTINPGDLVLFNPMENHTCEQVDNKALDYRCINIKTEVMKKAVLEITGIEFLPQFSQPVAYNCELVPLLCELHQAIMEEQQDFKKEETFLFLIKHLLDEYTLPYSESIESDFNTELKEVCKYIEEHFAEHITLDDLSKIAKMNKYSLLRTFTKSMGITPYRYLETVRINIAKRLLELGGKGNAYAGLRQVYAHPHGRRQGHRTPAP